MLTPDIEPLVHKAIGNKVKSLGGILHAVGGVENHIHLAVEIPPTMAISDFVGEVKGASSHHVNHSPKSTGRIAWQRGYAALTFSLDRMNVVLNYISNQKRHHDEGTLRQGLENYGDEEKRRLNSVREEKAEYLTDPFVSWE